MSQGLLDNATIGCGYDVITDSYRLVIKKGKNEVHLELPMVEGEKIAQALVTMRKKDKS